MSEFTTEFLKYFFTNPIIIIFIVVVLICFICETKIIGFFGEYWTKQVLRKLPRDKYKIINNVFISVNGSMHQIDHVVLSPFGVFSIETKQYNGFITGNKYDKHWVRHVGKKKYYYTNPIRQNYGHVKALSELLNLEESKVYNVVCIPSKAKLKIEHSGELTRYGSLADKILSYKREVIHNVDELVNIVNENNIKDNNIKKQHIENIKKNIVDDDLSKCPKCGSKLVERTSKYGGFLGCSNYPKCKYTRKI